MHAHVSLDSQSQNIPDCCRIAESVTRVLVYRARSLRLDLDNSSLLGLLVVLVFMIVCPVNTKRLADRSDVLATLRSYL